jgi:NAD(P)H-dependent flavin oxidoreductase YrpB (nitropropane dioxygenase family)
MRTSLCDRLGIDVPIVQAAMGGVSSPALAAAVSNAGGLGMLALSWSDEAAMRRQIRDTRSRTDRPFGVNLVLDWPEEERVAVCLDEGVPVVSFFWGDPAPFVVRAHDRGAVVLHTVASAEEAHRAVTAGVDVVVAQGWEAGGHVASEVATLPLVPSVVDAVAPVPVVAAGGIADGRGLAAALALGASGAWIGTRFLAAEEAAIHPRYRAQLFAATATDTVRTGLFDVKWPDAPHRVLRNKTFRAWEEAGRPPSGARPGEGELIGRSPTRGPIQRYQSCTPTADTEGDIEAMSLWAGQGVDLVRAVRPAAAILREIAAEAEATLARLAAGLRD